MPDLNNNLLSEIINDLQQVIDNLKDNLTIKRIKDIIIKLNDIINTNKKTTELIANHITSLQNQIKEYNYQTLLNFGTQNTEAQSALLPEIQLIKKWLLCK